MPVCYRFLLRCEFGIKMLECLVHILEAGQPRPQQFDVTVKTFRGCLRFVVLRFSQPVSDVLDIAFCFFNINTPSLLLIICDFEFVFEFCEVLFGLCNRVSVLPLYFAGPAFKFGSNPANVAR